MRRRYGNGVKGVVIELQQWVHGLDCLFGHANLRINLVLLNSSNAPSLGS